MGEFFLPVVEPGTEVLIQGCTLEAGSGRSGGVVKPGVPSAAGSEGGATDELERGMKAWRWDDVGVGVSIGIFGGGAALNGATSRCDWPRW